MAYILNENMGDISFTRHFFRDKIKQNITKLDETQQNKLLFFNKKEVLSLENKAYTPDEVAQVFQISKHTVYELIKRGELQAFKVGNKMRIEEQELERFKESTKAPAKKATVTEPAASEHSSLPIRLAGSHDFLVEHLVKQASSAVNQQIQPIFIGSLEGLMMLYRGQADIAAIHMLDPASQEYNVPFINRLFIYEPISLLRFASREQGFIVAKGNPKGIHDFHDLTKRNIQFVNRQKGSGTRFLFDSKIAALGIKPEILMAMTRKSGITCRQLPTLAEGWPMLLLASGPQQATLD